MQSVVHKYNYGIQAQCKINLQKTHEQEDHNTVASKTQYKTFCAQNRRQQAERPVRRAITRTGTGIIGRVRQSYLFNNYVPHLTVTFLHDRLVSSHHARCYFAMSKRHVGLARELNYFPNYFILLYFIQSERCI